MSTIFSKDREETKIIKPCLLAGGAEDEGAGKLQGPSQGGEGGRSGGVEGVTEGEHWVRNCCWVDSEDQQVRQGPHFTKFYLFTGILDG